MKSDAEMLRMGHVPLPTTSAWHGALKVLSWSKPISSSEVHAFITVGTPYSHLPSFSARTTLDRFVEFVPWLNRAAIASQHLRPLDVYAASWDELYCGNFAGVYLGKFPHNEVTNTGLREDSNQLVKLHPLLQRLPGRVVETDTDHACESAAMQHLQNRYAWLNQNVEGLLWGLWEHEPYCPRKNCEPYEDDIRPIQSVHLLIESADSMTLKAKSRTFFRSVLS